VDSVDNVPALRARAPADAEGIEQGAAARPRRRGLLGRLWSALAVAALLALVPSCGRMALPEPVPDALADASDGGPLDDEAPPACRCALRRPDAGCAPGCPGGLCCEAAP